MMRRRLRDHGWAGLAWCILAGLVGGCTATTYVASTKETSYQGEPKRLFVFERLVESPNLAANMVDHRLRQALTTCGLVVESRVLLPPLPGEDLAIDDAAEAEHRRAAADQIARFKPDSQLTVAEIRGTWRQPSHYMVRATYRLTLYDTIAKKTIWKASIDLAAARADSDSEGALAQAVVDRLSQDGILHACPPSPKSAAPPA
jgi:hypothetical protein